MKITKIKIKNLFGISECELDGSSVELSGTNGTGKTSVLDAIRYALTNNSTRDYVIKDGETSGEIIIETDTGLSLTRMKRQNQVDYKSLRDGQNIVTSPESFLRSLFTELQIDPVKFIQMSKKEQNRAILDLIEFEWDLNWIKEKFGELPTGVNYEQNILQVLHDIQADNGDYFMRRQDINREARNKRAFIEEIAAKLPANYDLSKWENYDLSSVYKKLSDAEHSNGLIARAQTFKDGYDGKKRGLQADYDMEISAQEKAVEYERTELREKIIKLQNEIDNANEKLLTLDAKLEDKKSVAKSKYEANLAKLDSDIQLASEYFCKPIIDTKEIKEEIEYAEKMKSYINECRRMQAMIEEEKWLIANSSILTDKIELARTLPGKILENATIPVDGLSVENGVPLIHGMPVSNLSEGEKLELCVDVTISKPAGLQIILIYGVERLSEENRKALYKKCQEKGIQFIATRTTDETELTVTAL